MAAWRLCCGCGACAYACENEAIKLVDIPDTGIRPVLDEGKCGRCDRCLEICPGIELMHGDEDGPVVDSLKTSWGPVLSLWEGHARDEEIRFSGSSGGGATVLALFALETHIAGQVLHIEAKSEAPIVNTPVLSTTREQLLHRTGSRYSPAAPCQHFDWIEQADSPTVFIGKPCDVAALRKAQAMNPELQRKVAFSISIFCAGTPSTEGTLAILNKAGIDVDDVADFRYRGNGWPGDTVVRTRENKEVRLTYEQSWDGILSRHIPLRCRLCPDGSGEFADISCGDSWYRPILPDEPGWSLFAARTEKGKDILHQAQRDGYVKMVKADPDILPLSQKGLLNKRRHISSRIAAMQWCRIPSPRYKGFSMRKNSRDLSLLKRAHAVAGTFKRIIQRHWYKPMDLRLPSND